MLYDYSCTSCDHRVIDHYQSIHDDPITLCPSCGSHSLQRQITGGLGAFVKDVKTIGQLADKNWSKVGTYKRSEIETQQKEKEAQNQSLFSQFGKASKKQINKMTAEQKQKYIITGDT